MTSAAAPEERSRASASAITPNQQLAAARRLRARIRPHKQLIVSALERRGTESHYAAWARSWGIRGRVRDDPKPPRFGNADAPLYDQRASLESQRRLPALFSSAHTEVDLADYAAERGIDPFASAERLLVRVLQGRFCFDLGLAAKCFAATISLTEGEHHELEYSLGTNFGGLKVATEYQFERSLEYNIGDCDSVAPVICYDDAEVLIYELRTNLLVGVWKRNEVIFNPTKRPFIAGNKVLDDPECGCARATAGLPPPR
jgi:hypothetical protein